MKNYNRQAQFTFVVCLEEKWQTVNVYITNLNNLNGEKSLKRESFCRSGTSSLCVAKKISTEELFRFQKVRFHRK